MNYQETLHWMFNQLPMYQNVGKSAYKEDLTNTLLLMNYLGNPDKNLKCIHVGGTNGKGSTSHLLASVLQESGYKVGLYTSPHLKDYRERIKINGIEISEDFVIDFIYKHRHFFEKNQLSFFEMTVGLAFEYFKKESVSIAIVEVGMGGRLDSTNIISPLISVITNIGLDHTQFLGTTLSAIATEKAGIIKPGIPVIIGEYNTETQAVFCSKAIASKANLYFASDEVNENYQSALQGDYQFQNKKTVIQTIRVLQSQGEFVITEENLKNGLLKVITNTGLQGRWQQLNINPKIIADTAHNEHGLRVVMSQIEKEKYHQLHIVLGVVNDKDLDSILPLFPKKAIYYFCKPNIPRGLDASILCNIATKYELYGKVYLSVTEAYETARTNAQKEDMIYVGGSTFVVAEIL